MQVTRVLRCDERFTGYGGNKAACLFEMYLSGISFYVLSDHFLIHQSHLYEEEARKSEVSFPHLRLKPTNILATKRKYNRRIHSDFKEETCLRYVHIFRPVCLSDTITGGTSRGSPIRAFSIRHARAMPKKNVRNLRESGRLSCR